MTKTNFLDGITPVEAAFLNKIFQHVHDGQDLDGHAPRVDVTDLAWPGGRLRSAGAGRFYFDPDPGVSSDLSFDSLTAQTIGLGDDQIGYVKAETLYNPDPALADFLIKSVTAGVDLRVFLGRESDNRVKIVIPNDINERSTLDVGLVNADNVPRALCRFRFAAYTGLHDDVTYRIKRGITKIERVSSGATYQVGWYDVWLNNGPADWQEIVVTATTISGSPTPRLVSIAEPFDGSASFSVRLAKADGTAIDEIDISLTAYWENQ